MATTPETKTPPAHFLTFKTLLQNEGFCFYAGEPQREILFYNRLTNKKMPQTVIPLLFRKHTPHGTSAEGIADYLRVSLPLVVGSIFKPRGEPLVTSNLLSQVNTYREFKPTTEDSDVSPLFLELFSRLFPDAEERHICTQWFAHIFQRPEERPTWHLLMSSEQGTGKGFLYNHILHPVLIHAAQVKTYDSLMGKHALVLEGNLLIMLDDPKSNSDTTMDKLKNVLSEPTAWLERKHQEAGAVATYARIMLASNEERPLKLDEGDRRWFVPNRIVHKESKSETQDFTTRLKSWLDEPDSLSKVFNYFRTYSLEGFNPYHIHQTDSHKKMVGMGESPLEDFYTDFLESCSVFQFQDIQNEASNAGFRNIDTASLQQALISRGFEKRRIEVKGKKSYYWRPVGMSNPDALKVIQADKAF